MDNYWQLGKWGGIPVAMHWTVLLVFAWMYLILGDFLAAAIASGALFVLFAAHEFGHVAVLRSRKMFIDRVTFYGIHGEVSHGPARKHTDEILVAWGGVIAQIVVLLFALLGRFLLSSFESSYLWIVAGPILFVFTKLNLFLILVALLPIGPFDGRQAWKVIPWLREKFRRRKRNETEIELTPEKRRELEESSEKMTADLLDKLGKK